MRRQGNPGGDTRGGRRRSVSEWRRYIWGFAIGGAAALSLSMASTSSAAETTQTFSYTGAEQTFTVPAGVSSVHVTAIGGSGGKAGAQGGQAAEVEGDLGVKPGQTLYVEVGGDGGVGFTVSPGGFNGGGEGAGGGGGASDVRTNPREEGLSPDSRLIVAGGGGGAGSFGEAGAGAGGPAGEAGESITSNEGGGPGTGSAGGAGGPGGCVNGTSGELAIGGVGGDCPGGYVGGGGGGGYYGGGGGGGGSVNGGAGGGGGSSLVPAGGSVRLAPFGAAPEVRISYKTTTPVGKAELGRCVATTGGNYQNSSCVTAASPAGTGKYEWEPFPFTKARFSLVNGPATFKTAVSKTTISCGENSVAGEYTGTQSASLGITFTGCKVLGPFGGQCTGEGAAGGEFSTSPLVAEFGIVEGAVSPPAVGWAIHPAAGDQFATFDCGGTEVSLTGSVIATATPINKMTAAFRLNFSGAGGIQKPESFEGGQPQVLTLTTTNATERVGLTMADSIANERLVEIKATS